jgi:serine/threonine-protein kinase
MVVQPDGVLKVMDFGIARLAQRTEGQTQAGMILGTPEYMAPEQLLAEDIDVRADLYWAGVVLYECLTGARPHSAPSAIMLFTKVLEETPRSPGDRQPDISAALPRAHDAGRDRTHTAEAQRTVCFCDPNPCQVYFKYARAVCGSASNPE